MAAAIMPHIAVVGAGLAGLRCTDILLQHGFKVTILEARIRLGGRMYQEKLPNGHLVDMGPNWIHGTNNNPLLDLAKETETDIGTWDDMFYMFNEKGNILPAAEGEKHVGRMWEVVAEAFKHSNKNFADIDPNESLHDFFNTKLPEMIPDTEENFEEKRKIIKQISELWGAFVGSSITKQSLKFFWLEESIDGDNLFCAGTYQKILEKISKPAIEGADIKLGTKVDKIFSRKTSGDQVKIHTSGGELLEVDDVVVTSPLGWLKRNLSAFEPALPDLLEKAIASIAYGCLEKVYVTFPKAFWLAGETNDDKARGFIQWTSPTYAPDSNPERWNQEAIELASLTEKSSHPTLLFYTFGDESEYLTGEVANLKTKEERDAFLLNFFKPYYSRLPHYSADDPDCQPSHFLPTSWVRDELAGYGSYTNFQVGLQEGDKDIETMREGLPDQGLWFAGEHTAPFVALGTATGAYWSGEAVGKRIAEAHGKTASIEREDTK